MTKEPPSPIIDPNTPPPPSHDPPPLYQSPSQSPSQPASQPPSKLQPQTNPEPSINPPQLNSGDSQPDQQQGQSDDNNKFSQEIQKAIDFKNNRNSKMASALILTGIASFICLVLIAFNPTLQAIALSSELIPNLTISLGIISGVSSIAAGFVASSGIDKNPKFHQEPIYDGINKSHELTQESSKNKAKDSQDPISNNSSLDQSSWVDKIKKKAPGNDRFP
jgi:uncharacterized membrane protein (DUF485 family)